MSSAAQLTQAHIFTSLLSSVSPSSPLSDSLLHSLALSVSPTALLDALDLIDRDSVSRLAPPSGRAIYQVQSQSGGGGGGASYTVVVGGGCAGAVGGGYCPCPAFQRGVMAGEGVVCKHLLAVLLSLRLSPSLPSPFPPSSSSTFPPSSPGKPITAPSAPTRSAFFEKKVTLDYLAGLATKFGAANPPQAGARQAGQAGQAGGAG